MCARLTELMHVVFLVLQWHRSPFDAANTKDARFLYRRGCLDEDRAGDGADAAAAAAAVGGGAAAAPAADTAAAVAAAAGAASVSEGAAAMDRVLAEAVGALSLSLSLSLSLAAVRLRSCLHVTWLLAPHAGCAARGGEARGGRTCAARRPQGAPRDARGHLATDAGPPERAPDGRDVGADRAARPARFPRDRARVLPAVYAGALPAPLLCVRACVYVGVFVYVVACVCVGM
jgi:hypothetical protein